MRAIKSGQQLRLKKIVRGPAPVGRPHKPRIRAETHQATGGHPSPAERHALNAGLHATGAETASGPRTAAPYPGPTTSASGRLKRTSQSLEFRENPVLTGAE
jgi:hypothetical protein